MSLRINHNASSINAFRNLTQVDGALAKNLERLSSGLRINTAGDDPAGLAISQQLRAQIGGLNQSIENSEIAVNMLETAESALAEVHNLLNSMRELAIHAANEAVNDSLMLQADQDQLGSSIDTINRIAAETQFGTKYLLDGSADNVVSISTNSSDIERVRNSTLNAGTHSITVSSVLAASQSIDNQGLGFSDPANVSGLDAGDHTIVVTQESDGAIITGDDIDFGSPLTIAAGVNDQFSLELDGGGAMTVTVGAASYASAAALATAVETAVDAALTTAGEAVSEITVTADGDHLVFATGDEGSAASLSITDSGLAASVLGDIRVADNVAVGTDAIVTLDNQVNYIYDIDDANIGSTTLTDAAGNSVDLTIDIAANGMVLGTTTLTYRPTSFLVQLDNRNAKLFEVGTMDVISNGRESVELEFGEDVAAGTSVLRAAEGSLKFQIGANESQYTEVTIASISATQLGTATEKLTAVDVRTFEGAQAAISVIDAAIDEVSKERAELGAFQRNVLEPNLTHLRIAAENLTAAESTIRDTNMASEMAEFTSNQILQQAAIAMLAQANAAPQAVLQLLG